MNRSRLLALFVCTCALLALPLLSAGPAAAKSCGTVMAFYPDTEGGSGMKLTFVTGVSCRHARRIVKRCIRQRHVRGWHARVNDFGVAELYSSPRRRILMRGVAGGGPHCFART